MMYNQPLRRFMTAGLAAAALTAGSAVAQEAPRRGLPPAQPKPAQPSQPSSPVTPAPSPPGMPATPGTQAPAQVTPVERAPAAANRQAPEPGPYITRTNPRDLTLSVRLLINSDAPTDVTRYRDPFTGKTVDMPNVKPFDFQTLALVWPVPPTSASADQDPSAVAGQLRVNDALASDTPDVLTGYPGGVRLIKFSAGDQGQQIQARQVDLRVAIPMRCYRTRFDETAALRVPWPVNGWPSDIGPLMRPQLYIESGVDGDGHVRMYDDKIVGEAMKKFLEDARISDPKGISPVALAKILTAGVWKTMQSSGQGLSMKRTGELSGVVLQSPAESLETGKGSDHDLTVALAAVLRKAGLPARVMIGWDAGSRDPKFLSKCDTTNQLRSWVEFMLYDESHNTVNWIPVDIAKLRRVTSRPQALTQKWKYFGEHDELDNVTPFAIQFHPPTDVVSYGWPGFWGWFVTPEPPKAAEQALTFNATVTARTTPDRDDKRDSKRDKRDAPAPNRGYR